LLYAHLMHLAKCDSAEILVNLSFSKESYVSFLILNWHIITRQTGRSLVRNQNPDPSPYHVNLFALLITSYIQYMIHFV
jgi:hypothetical protein